MKLAIVGCIITISLMFGFLIGWTAGLFTQLTQSERQRLSWVAQDSQGAVKTDGFGNIAIAARDHLEAIRADGVSILLTKDTPAGLEVIHFSLYVPRLKKCYFLSSDLIVGPGLITPGYGVNCVLNPLGQRGNQ